MGANTPAGTIQRYPLINATIQPLIFPTRSDAGVLLTHIPANVDSEPVCIVTLPDNPATGDTFYIANQDGTAGNDNVILILAGASTSGGTTFADTAEAWVLFQGFAGVNLVYSADANDWAVAMTDTAAFLLADSQAGTYQQGSTSQVAAGNMAAPAGTVLAAISVLPKSSGVFAVTGFLTCEVSAADTVAFALDADSGLTADVSGGTLYGDNASYGINVENGAGGGVVVVPSTTTTLNGTIQREVPAAEAGGGTLVTFPINGYVNVPDAGDFPSAIVVRVTSAATLSGCLLNLNAKETF
jgi:hypothetical protein